MILIDTGPFVALFDRQDAKHEACKDTLKAIEEPLCTTIPVLTEAFHLC
jgi:predicted nucleic acid-binding protein